MIGKASKVAAAVTGLLLLWPTRSADADIFWDLVPTLSVGVTDNARATASGLLRVRDEFGTAALGAHLRYQGARTSLALANNAAGTHFFEQKGVDTLSDDAALMFARSLSAFVDLRVTASGGIARVSGTNTGDLTAFVPSAAATGTNVYYTVGASQEVSYQPNQRRRYAEAVGVTRLDYLTRASPFPTSTAVAARLQTDWIAARDRYFVHGDFLLTETVARPQSAMTADARPVFAQGTVFMPQVLGGWRRELNALWTVEAQAGPLMLFKAGGPYILTHTEQASVSYRRVPWFATLSLGEVASPNLYVGNATVNTQVLLRLAVPLDRREQVYIGGYGGYIYARMASDRLQLTKAFDQLTAGGSLTARMQRYPFWAALIYSFVTQRGSSQPGLEIPDLRRRTLTLAVGGAFSGAPGTASLFSGTP